LILAANASSFSKWPPAPVRRSYAQLSFDASSRHATPSAYYSSSIASNWRSKRWKILRSFCQSTNRLFSRLRVVPDSIERGIINPRLFRVRPCHEVLHPVFLAHVLTSSSITRLFGNVATGITMGVLNAGLLKQLRVPLPPLPLQTEFAQRVAEIRDLEAAQAASHQRLEALFQSLLHRAFQGEL
jgi:hypothetical protein